MGREAQCTCRWGDRYGTVTVLLESNGLIVRGDFRAKATRDAIEQVNVRDENLEFFIAGELVSLALGAVVAQRWAVALAAPPPSLARKLGITSATRVHMSGPQDDEALHVAVTQAMEIVSSISRADIAIVRADNSVTVQSWLNAAGSIERVPPVWIVYVKGPNSPFGEHAVRKIMLGSGFTDTKVAAISSRLSALRFHRKRS